MIDRLTKSAIFATFILSSAALSPLLRAGDSEPVDPRIAKNITITGCLHAGAHAGQFVLLGVTERTLTGALVPVPYSVYMLDSTKDLKHLVGELVDVDGVVVSKDKKAGTVKVVVTSDEETVAVGKDSKPVTTKAFLATPTADSVVELSRPIYRVHVDTIMPAGFADGAPACR